jgi:phosphate/phosphite/phosphonate ABC transporter binding protein
VPFAIKGYEKDFQGYNLIVVVKKDSPFQKLSDLKGKKVAHTAPSSNSGHMAPMALFPAQGLTPEKDYKIIFSGKHDQSVLGVNSGDYDAAAVASGRLPPHGHAGQIKEENFRVIYRSAKFPTSSFAYAHDLETGVPRQDAQVLLRLPLQRRYEEGLRRRRPLLPDQLQGALERRARSRRGWRRQVQPRGVREGDEARGRSKSQEKLR